MSPVLFILGLLAFVGLVVLHELGHFFAARRNGVEVEEFGIGFPPAVWRKRMKSGFDFTINILPLGGFVKLKGEHDDDTEKGSFGAATLVAKIKIMVAGVGMNLLTAFVLLTIVALLGMPKLVENQFTVASDTKISDQRLYVGFIEEQSPAAQAGLQLRDQITRITSAQGEQVVIDKPEALPGLTKRLAGQKVELEYVRSSNPQKTSIQLRSSEEVESSKATENPKGYLGIATTEYVLQRSTWSAPIVAGGVIKQFTELTLKGIGTALGGLFTGNTQKASEQVSGPVGIFFILKDGSIFGASFMLMIIAVISLTLAIMNVLPIPALDGGRLFVLLLFRVMKKRLTPKTEERIHGTGMAVLLSLLVLVTIVDIKRFF